MKRSDFMRKEFVGLEVAVSSSKHAPYLNVKGVVVGETKNTLLIEMNGREIIVPKAGSSFSFTYESEQITVQGSEIQHRPEDRIKKTR
ncbi:MAG TPA: ribonuclease P protein subunit [Methanomassiliicoccales archaeon]|nr:ribonuclease P protein subunit [Methanomassiliicoccales archaeon]